MRRTFVALVLFVLVGTTLSLVPPSAAVHSCSTAGIARTLNNGTWQASTVYDNRSVPGGNQFWYYFSTASLTSAILVAGVRENPPVSTSAPHVQINPPSAYLRIWDWSCTFLVCEAHAAMADPAVCTFSGNVKIQVLYGYSEEFHVDYTLFLAQT